MNEPDVKRKIILRADANAFIGFGHASRLLAIASFLSSEFDLVLVSDCRAESLIAEFTVFGVEIIPIETSKLYSHPDEVGKHELPWDIPEDLAEHAHIIVLDGYWFGEDYRKKCQEHGLKTAVIDDFVKPISHANLILNHAPGIDERKYEAHSDCRVATGLSYAMLRPEFFKEKINSQAPDEGFVCFGGIDSLMLSAKAASFLLKNEALLKVTVLISSLTVQLTLDALHELAHAHAGRLNIVQNLQAKEVCEILDRSKYAIVPASTVLYEAFYRGCICLCGKTADNQSVIYQGFTQSGYAFGLGDLRSTSVFPNQSELWERLNSHPFNKVRQLPHPANAVLTLFKQL